MSKMKTYLDNLERVEIENEENIEKTHKEILKTGEQFKSLIDDLVSEQRKTLQESRKNCSDSIQKMKIDVKSKMVQVEKNLQEYREVSRCNNFAKLQEMANLLEGSMTTIGNFEMDPHIDLPIFLPGKVDKESLSQQLGCLDISQPGVATEVKLQKNESEEENDALGANTMLKEPIIIKQHTLDASRNLLSCVGTNEAFVTKYSHGTIARIDRDGNTLYESVQDTVNDSVNFTCLATTKDRKLVITEQARDRVLIWSDTSVKTLFKTKTLFTGYKGPYGICSPANDRLLVSFPSEGKIIRYNFSGNVLFEFSSPKVTIPRNISFNPVNNYVCVCDTSSLVSKGKVVVFDAYGNFKFEYLGQNEIYPAAICADRIGNILIADFINDQVHILSQLGEFIRYLLSRSHSLYRPVSIDLDADGYLWITEETSALRVVRYRKQ